MLNLLCLFSPKKQQRLRNVLCCVPWWLCIWCSAWTLVNNTQNWTRRPFIFVIPTRLVSDNFEVKDKKQNVSLGALKFMWGTTKTTLHQGRHSEWWSAIYGEIQMRSIVCGKSQRDLSCPWPLRPFNTSSPWVTLMCSWWLKTKKQSTMVQLNSRE